MDISSPNLSPFRLMTYSVIYVRYPFSIKKKEVSMEPLVIFGALLVVYCGYLALLDSVRDWKTRRLPTPAEREPVKRRAPMFTGECRPRSRGGIPVGNPLLQRV
jgi:hypothetical protein